MGYGSRGFLDNEAVDASYRQTEDEHEDYINDFREQHEDELIKPGMNPLQIALAKAEAQYLAEEDEKTLIPQYWDDTYPRRDVDTQSTWVDNIEISPYGGMAEMTTRNGRTYYYPLDTDDVGDWVTDDMGIGSHYNTYIKH